jgi:tRNA threonylcarbamoyladenosine biosynthesis protein TsaE
MICAFATAESLQAAAAALAPHLAPGDAIALEGPMGAGKTTFAQGLAQGLGAEGEITSPTFALMNQYTGRLPIFHLDLYRLDDPARLAKLGYDPELADSGVTLVEWADKWWPFWTDDVLRIELAPTPTGRRLTAEALGEQSGRLLALWRENL